MKKKIKKLTCKLFGHIEIEEMYAIKTHSNKYHVCRELKCLRCGKTISFQLTERMSRAEMLQRGWFIEK